MKNLKYITIIVAGFISCCNNLSAQCWFLNKDFDAIHVDTLAEEIISKDLGYGFAYKFLVDNYDRDKDSVIYLSLYYQPDFCDSNHIMKLDHDLNVLEVKHCGDVPTRWKINNRFYGKKDFIDPEDNTLRAYQLCSSDIKGKTSTFDICKIPSTMGGLLSYYSKNQFFVDYDKNFVLFLGDDNNNSEDSTVQFNIFRISPAGTPINKKHFEIDKSIWAASAFNVSIFQRIIPAEDFLVVQIYNDDDDYNLNQKVYSQVTLRIKRDDLSIIDTLVVYSSDTNRYLTNGEPIILQDGKTAIINDLGRENHSRLDFYNYQTQELIARMDIPFDSVVLHSAFLSCNGGVITNELERTFMSFTKLDSIYYAISVPEDNSTNLLYDYGWLQVNNFSSEGELNYSKTFTNIHDDPVDVVALSDGNLAMLCVSPISWHTKIMKFTPINNASLQTLDKEDIFAVVYPNPAKDVINISSSEVIHSLKITNFAGQTVYSSKESGKTATINTQNLEKGSYLLQISTDKGITTKKVVIE